MSRTRKDRPYWVRENDSTLTNHKHLLCGKTVYKRQYLVSEEGEPLYYHNKGTKIGFDWSKGYENGVTELQARIHRELYKEYWVEVEYDWGWFPAFELVVDFVYPDECTAGQKHTKESQRFRNGTLPCTPEMPPEESRHRHGFSTQEDRAILSGSSRRKSRDTLIGYAKEYNANGDVDDSDMDVSQHRHSMSWWW